MTTRTHQSERTSESQEMWLIGGQVLVYADDEVHSEEAIGVQDDRIIFVGSIEDARMRMADDATVHDLQGRTVMPGLHDAHMHGRNRSTTGWVQSSCDLGYEGGTVDDVLAKLHRGLLAESEVEHLHSDYVFVAINLFAPALSPARRVLTRDDLDRLSRDPEEDRFGTGTTRPIIVFDKGIHSNFANSTAIENAGVEQMGEDPGHVGRDSNGRVTGVFNDFAGEWGPMAPVTGDEDHQQRISDLEEANSLGITSIFEAAGTMHSAEVWARLADEGRLTARVNQSINVTDWARGNADTDAIAAQVKAINEVRSRYHSYLTDSSPGSLSIDTVKIFADGEAEYPHQTAAMIAPYNTNVGTEDAPEWQPSSWRGDDPSASDALESFRLLDSAKWNIHVHCLGDRSAQEAIDNFEDIAQTNAVWDRRHTICHLAFITRDDIRRMRELRVMGNMSLQWARRDAWSVDAYSGYISQDMLDRAYPARELLDDGVALSGGSDWPVDPLNPWLQIQCGVTREGIVTSKNGVYPGQFAASERVTIDEALMMHTLGGAKQMHQDDVTGSIEVGKYADLIVLDENPRLIDESRIADICVEATLLGGRLVSGALPAAVR